MEEHRPSLTNILSISSAFLALVIGGYVLYDRPFQSERPTSGIYTPFLETRLWEDPLRAVFAIRQREEQELMARTSADGLQDQVEEGAVSPTESLAYGGLVRTPRQFHALHIEGTSPEDIQVIGVTLPGSRFAVAEETRRQIRYAVLAALNDRYIPNNSENISLLRLDNPRDSPHEPYEYAYASYETYDYYSVNPATGGRRNRQVVLLWLPEDILGSSLLQHYSHIIGQLYRHSPMPAEHILLGPTNSNRLINLYSELAAGSMPMTGNSSTSAPEAANPSPPHRIRVFSPRATIAPAGIAASLGMSTSQLREERFEPLVRAINDDGTLVDVIMTELDRRFIRDVRDIRVALIYESDGKYGRGFHSRMDCELIDANAVGDRLCVSDIDNYGYLRGIDGRHSGQDNESNTSNVSSTNLNEVLGSSVNLENPFGSHQYDYLRRLAGVIHGQKYDVIGVLGTDVFDKLLVLQALREVNPDTLFFTTDLDTYLTDASQSTWTRNLLVASAYTNAVDNTPSGICRSGRNILTPPFRNSYQTAYFYATCLATTHLESPVEDIQAQMDLHLADKHYLYEIGRQGARMLQQPGDPQYAGAGFLADTSQLSRTLLSWLLLCTPIGFIAAIFGTRSGRAREILTRPTLNRLWVLHGTHGVLFALFGSIVGLAIYQARWVTLPLYVIGAVLCLLGMRQLKRATQMTTRQVAASHHVPSRHSAEPSRLEMAYVHGFCVCVLTLVAILLLLLAEILLPGGEPVRVFQGISHWPATVIRVQIFAITICFATYCSGMWLCSKENIEQKVKGLRKGDPFLHEWQNYLQDGSKARRKTRIISRTLILSTICLLTYYLFTPQPALIRESYPLANFLFGEVFTVILAVGVITMTMLSADATLRCRNFIRRLRHIDLDAFHFDPRSIGLKPLHDQTLDNGVALIRLVATRTSDLKRIIFYPFFILFLLILSRSTLFEGWYWSIELVFIYLTISLLLLTLILMLQREARLLRGDILHTFSELTETRDVDGLEKERLTHAVHDAREAIDLMHEGVYTAWYRHPVFQALALPTTGTSGLLLLQQFF